MTKDEVVWSVLMETWLPLAAIAKLSKLPIRTCESILVKYYNEGKVKCSRVRIDGHNRVHLFKKIEYASVLSMKIVVETSNLEFSEREA